MNFVKVRLGFTDADSVRTFTAGIEAGFALEGGEEVFGPGQLQFRRDEVIGASTGAMLCTTTDALS